MAYAPHRSMTADMSEGVTDGTYKKVVRDRGGQVDRATYEARRDLYDRFYGIHETPLKTFPDALEHGTPNFVPTKEPDLL